MFHIINMASTFLRSIWNLISLQSQTQLSDITLIMIQLNSRLLSNVLRGDIGL